MHTLPLTPTVPVAVPFPVTVHSDNYACAMHNQRDKVCSRLRMQIEQLKLTCPLCSLPLPGQHPQHSRGILSPAWSQSRSRVLGHCHVTLMQQIICTKGRRQTRSSRLKSVQLKGDSGSGREDKRRSPGPSRKQNRALHRVKLEASNRQKFSRKRWPGRVAPSPCSLCLPLQSLLTGVFCLPS